MTLERLRRGVGHSAHGQITMVLPKTKEAMMSIDSKTLVSLSAIAGFLIVGAAVTLTADDKRAAFHGVWRTVEVTVAGATSQTFRPSATLAIFHGGHYSRVEVHTEEGRPLLADQSKASADELRAVWGP